MTAGICSICDGTVGQHNLERHKAYDQNRAAWARPRDVTAIEASRLKREVASLRRRLAQSRAEAADWQRVATDPITGAQPYRRPATAARRR